MFMRDAVIYDYMPSVDNISGYLAYRGGQAFFSWLADEYGKDKIGDLMMQIKAIGDVDEGFFEVYKYSIEELSEKWHKHLKQTYWPDIKARQEITDFANRLTNSRKGDGFYNTAPAISPKGDKIAYISNRDDYFDVYIAEIPSGKIITKLIEGNVTADFEELHLLTPGLCWSPDGNKIAISVKSGSEDAIHIIDTDNGNETSLPIKFDGIFSVRWNPDNNSLVYVGNNSRQSDIWVFNLRTGKNIQITDDVFSDSDPTWSKDGRKIFFSSDRGDHTSLKDISTNLKISKLNYSEKDLYVFDLENSVLKRFIGEKNSKESFVICSPDSTKILYLSDKNGIRNIYKRDLNSGEDIPVTNSLSPIDLLSASEDCNRIAFTALNKGGYDIFYLENPFEINLGVDELQKTVFAENLFSNIKDSVSKLGNILYNDSVQNISISDSLSFSDSVMSSLNDTNLIYGENIALKLNTETDDTSLVKPKFKLKESSKFKLTDNTNEDGSFKAYKYKIKFSPDIIYSNVSYSSFYGVQGIAQMAFSDVLGNHRIYVATSLVLDLKNSDYAFAYLYLPKRIDFGIEAFHSARFLLIEQYDQTIDLYRYRTYGSNFYASYPINKFKRLDGVLSFAVLSKENLDKLSEPIQKLYSVVPGVSFVHDNTLFGYTAPMRGTRYNFTFLGSPKLGKDGAEFFTSVLDYRTYVKLFDDYNFVWRFNGGFSLGKNPQRFYIGGTPNWINYEVENDKFPIEDIKDFAFSSPVMPLRGYNYNAASGSKFMLMNTEFRFPLIKYLVVGPLPLGFQNIQGVLFADIGTVWTNNKTLQFFTRDSDGRFITKDLLVGMGIGTRLFLLYFPFKFDVAWTYNMRKFSTPKYYISLGADF
jgi:Tol biopolymer transport system component